MVTSAEAVRDPEHDGVITVIDARPLILWNRDFHSVAHARRAVSVSGRAEGMYILLGSYGLWLLQHRSRATAAQPACPRESLWSKQIRL